MKLANPGYTLGLSAAVAMLFGCGGSQSPIGAPGAMPQSYATATHGERGGSWMRPEAKSEDLLYVSSETSGDVYVYTYPQGNLVGTLAGLTGVPAGECVDSSGDVFVTAVGQESDPTSTIYEYAHGGTTPIASLNDPGLANGCAVDPTSGTLAVVNPADYSSSNPYPHHGDVAIYTDAQGTPTMYYSSEFVGFVFCGYDDKGNLYLSASNGEYGNQLQLARLASGSGSFELIDLNAKLYTGFLFGSSVQWDGKHMTVSSDHNPQHEAVSVYRLSISGSSARVIGTTSLSSRKERHAGQSWNRGEYDPRRRRQRLSVRFVLDVSKRW